MSTFTWLLYFTNLKHVIYKNLKSPYETELSSPQKLEEQFNNAESEHDIFKNFLKEFHVIL